MIELPTLYPHQQEQIQSLRHSLAGNDASILCARAGGGKTRMSKWMIGANLNRDIDRTSGKCLFVVYGRNLVDNAVDSFGEEPALPLGVIMSGAETDWSQNVFVASIDTVLSWYVEDGEYMSKLTFDLVIYDECHVAVQKLRKFIEPHADKRESLGLRTSKLIGLSATPDHKEQAAVFGAIVNGPKTEWMIENGYLSRFEYYHATQGQLGKLIRKGSQYTEESVSDAMRGLTGDLVSDWRKHGHGRPTVGFFPRRSHAKEACELLCEDGVVAEYVDGETSDEDRRNLFRHLGTGRIEYLCNVGIVERGTNIPEIGCIQLATVVRKRSRLEQMLGRGSRTAPGKRSCIVIDHGSNIHGKPDSLGFFEDDHPWTLDATSKDATEGEGKPTVKCPACERVYRGGRCTCGYEPKPKELKSQGLEFVAGEMVKLDREKIKPTPKPLDCEKLLISTLYRKGKYGTWKQAIAMCYSEARKKGESFRFPASFDVGGKTYRPIPKDHPDGNRRLRDVYDFLERRFG